MAFKGGDFIQVLEIGVVFFSETRTGGTRTTSPFCNLYSGLIRPLFTRTSLYVEYDKSNFWYTF